MSAKRCACQWIDSYKRFSTKKNIKNKTETKNKNNKQIGAYNREINSKTTIHSFIHSLSIMCNSNNDIAEKTLYVCMYVYKPLPVIGTRLALLWVKLLSAITLQQEKIILNSIANVAILLTS